MSGVLFVLYLCRVATQRQTKNTEMSKHEILKAIGSRLMDDARVYMNSPERPYFPTDDNQPTSFLATCDAMEDIDKLLGWA